MSQNYIPEIAKMLGVEVGEEFSIRSPDGDDQYGPYMFDGGCPRLCYKTDGGVWAIDDDDTITDILFNGWEIVKKPWKPKHGETFRYWAISFMEDMPMTLMIRPWDENSTYYFMLYRLGNCYPTKEAAEADREKWERFYGSDDPIDWEGNG